MGSSVTTIVGSTNQPVSGAHGAPGEDAVSGQFLGRVDGGLQAPQRALVDDRAQERLVPGRVADHEPADGVGERALQVLPQAARDVGAGRGRALLALVLERAPGERDEQRLRVGRGVRDDGVLAAGLADDPRVAAVVADVAADLRPQVAEHGGRPGEVQTGELLVGHGLRGDVRTGAVHLVDHAGRHACLGQHPHDHLGGRARTSPTASTPRCCPSAPGWSAGCRRSR